MSEITTTTPAKKTSLLAKFSERYSLEPAKMLDTLKATAFKGNVSNEQMVALLIVADQYKLNPFTKEIYAFPDKGGIVPVVGVDGWARIINEHPAFDGMELTVQDGEDGLECTCTIYRKDRSHPIRVTEYMVECRRSNAGPWASHPRRMLRHKAMIQCARLAFGFVGIYDQDEAERIVVDVTPSPAAAPVAPAGGKLADKIKAATRKPAPSRPEPPAEIIDMETGEVDRREVDDFIAEMDAAERG